MNKAKKLAAFVAAVTIASAGGAAGISALHTSDSVVKAEDIVLETSEPTEASTSTDSLPNVKAISQKVMPAIVAITAESKETIMFWGRQYEQNSESAGSGVIIAKNDEELMIATNNHVVDGADDLTVLFSVDTEDEEDALVPALVKGTDSSLDLAVVAVKLEDIPDEVLDQIAIAEIGDSDAMEVGDWTIAIGNALGYGQSVTFGIVSALDREVTLSTDEGSISQNMLQTDAAINFGNSGGALLNADGQLIGINSAKASSEGVEGMGYAIPINVAKPILEDLMNQTTRTLADEDHAGALGVQVTNVSEEARQLYGIPAGAYVMEVNEDGAADEAGMKKGDIITKLDRTTISSMNELLDRIKYYEAGESVEVTVKRPSEDGYSEVTLTVTLQEKAKTDSDTEEETEAVENDDQNSNSDNPYTMFEDFFNNYNDSDDSSEEENNSNPWNNNTTGFGYHF